MEDNKQTLENLVKKPIMEAHGKVENTQPTMLEQVWGYNELARYGTMDEDVYRNQVDEMNRSDLETHARKLGVVVVESTTRLREKLFTAFRTYVSLVRKPADLPKSKTITDSAALRVLAEGR
jgi:hypothetical protein